MKEKALIIVSGGMDSVTLLHDINRGYHVKALSFNYGSKHNQYELEMAKKNCNKLNINHTILNMDFINKHFKSDLLKSGNAVPEGHYAEKNMQKTVVPFRNGILLSIAVGFAESNDCSVLFIGAHSGDHSIYPDCTPEFIRAIDLASRIGTYKHVEISAPYENLDKSGILSIGKDVNVDYNDTWTCYNPTEKDGKILSCGKCGSCVERLEAFYLIKQEDPKLYCDKEYYKKILNLK